MMKILILLGAVGCAAPAGPHVISGTVEQQTFAAQVDQVVVIQTGSVIARAPITSGAFSITIPAGTGYRLELRSSSDRSGLVSPRATGIVDSTFAIRGGGPAFDVGMVRAIAPGTNFVYSAASTDCQDGKDASGNVCVDDQQAENCADGGGEGDSADASGGETSDGEAPSANAVADHNIPSSIGCGDGGDSGGDHQSDGEEQGDH